MSDVRDLAARTRVQASVNAAAALLAQWVQPEDVAPAVQLFRAALAVPGRRNNTELMAWLARALFDARGYPAAKRLLHRAMHLRPHDYSLCFNAALVMQEHAKLVRAPALTATQAAAHPHALGLGRKQMRRCSAFSLSCCEAIVLLAAFRSM